MTKKIRLQMIKIGINIVKNMFKMGFIDKQTAIVWMTNITVFFAKKEE